MSTSRLFAVIGLLGAAWFGRGLVVPALDADEAPLPPIARYVELDSADIGWEPNPDVRDPFVPLVLPSVPALDTSATTGE